MFVLDLFAGTLVQVNVKSCLFLALGNLLDLQVIHSLWLSHLNLDACRKDQDAHCGQLLPSLVEAAVQQQSPGSLTRSPLPASACEAQSLEEPLAEL